MQQQSHQDKNMAKNISQLSDDEILHGFRQADSRVVKDYFYGYCRVAYGIYDKRYGLRHKPGMDFYSLAHEYYLALCKHDFRQLEDRKPTMSLKTWMVNGFRFLLLDKLKAVEKEHRFESFEERMAHSRLEFDVSDSEFAADFRRTISDICLSYYGNDRKNSVILQMLFIEGFTGKEVAARLGMSPSAVTQRCNRMMHDVVVPYFKRYFTADVPGLVFMPKPEACISSDDLEMHLSCIHDIMRKRADESHKCLCTKRSGNNELDDMDFNFDWQDSSPASSPRQNEKKVQRVTPEWVYKLGENEVFVFGSDLAGASCGEGARMAHRCFGAVVGEGAGMQGQSYAIPTMQGGVEAIRPYVGIFI